MSIFVAKDKTKRKIKLGKVAWKHIIEEHPQVVDIEEIKLALSNPDILHSSRKRKNIGLYYKFNKQRKIYLMVSARYLNGQGYIITAFHTRKIK